MAQQTINVGTAPNDGTGTPLRTAFQYTNSNFSELYTAVGPSGNNIVVPGSATITGDLTVDTNTLKVDSANNRVGIVKTTPAYPLDVGGRISYSGAIGEGADTTVSSIGTSLLFGNAANWSECQFFAGGNLQHRMQSAGVFTWLDGAGGTRMTLNSTGLGVGAAPQSGAKLTIGSGSVAGYSDTIFLGGNSNNTAQFRILWNHVGAGYLGIGTANDAYGSLIFGQASGANGAVTTEWMRIDGSGNVGIGVTPSAGKGCLQLSSGINFPATQVASSDANTLDDYEEGTFTPGITFGGASVGMTGTFAGRYTKVGRAVTINGIIALTAKGSSTGIAKISGLPFTSANASGEYTAISIRLDRVSFADYPCGYVGPNSSVVELENTTNAGTVSSMTDSNFINTSVVIVNFTYTV